MFKPKSLPFLLKQSEERLQCGVTLLFSAKKKKKISAFDSMCTRRCKGSLFNNFVKLRVFLTALGAVVQSIVSLTSLLRGQLVKCFITK